MILGLALNLSSAEASEFFFQAPAKTAAVSVQAGYRRFQTFSGNSDTPADTQKGLYRTGLKADYGLNDRLSISAAVSYTDLESKSENTAHVKGIEPLNLTLRGQEHLPELTVLYGAEIQVGLEKASTDAKRNINRTFGDYPDGINRSFTLTPFLGLARVMGAGEVGALLSYEVFKTDHDLQHQRRRISLRDHDQER